jgi:acetyltransferase
VAVRCGAGLRWEKDQTPGTETPGREKQAPGTGVLDEPAAPLRGSPANGFLSSAAARDLLAGAGIPVIETVLCGSLEEAAAAARRLGYPAVAKVDHPDLIHKSDAGGVRLGLASAEEVAGAAAELLGLAEGAGVLVQHQHHGVELLVGGIRDPEFGAMVMAGLGGVLAETQHDVQLAVAPVDTGQARAMLSSLRGAAILGGLRGSPPVGLGFVAEIIVAVGDLMAAHPEIAELDLNPVLAGPDGCVAVDWRIGTR